MRPAAVAVVQAVLLAAAWVAPRAGVAQLPPSGTPSAENPTADGAPVDVGRGDRAHRDGGHGDDGQPQVQAPRVELGIDVLLSTHVHLVQGKRVGLITNTSGVDRAGKATLDRLVEDPRVQVVQLYGPEHGIRLQHRNNHTDRSGVDAVTGIALQGLNCSGAPSARTLARLDVLVFDVQDIGSRTYTYVTTMGKAMKAAAQARVPFIVLDRPNPNGGLRFEGPIREARHRSVVGWAPLPVTHGMTVGELAGWYNKELRIGADLTVVPMRGWRREMTWEDTGLRWRPTSTAITEVRHAHLYVATGMLGGAGLNLNEGVSAGFFFERIGAPFIDGERFAVELRRAELPGVHFEPVRYQTFSGPDRGKELGGVHLTVTDPHTFRPLHTALTALVIVQRLYPKQLRVRFKRRFGRVWGTWKLLEQLKRGWSVARIEASWHKGLERFRRSRARQLIYP